MKRLLSGALFVAVCSLPLWAWSWTLSRDLHVAGWNTGFTILGTFPQGPNGPYSLSPNCGSMIYGSTFTNTVLSMMLPQPGYAKYYQYFGADTSGNWVYRVEVSAGTGQIKLQQNVSGTATDIAMVGSLYLNGPNTIRTVINGTTLAVLVDGVPKLKFTIGSVSGKVGFGVCNSVDQGGGIKHIDIGTPETVPPNAVPSGNITSGSFINHIDLQWTASSDDASGIGLLGYQILRFGQALTALPITGLTYSDATSSPSSTYSYTVRVVDGFFNYADTTVSIQSPPVPTNEPYPSEFPEGRSVGVRTTGTYWGAGSENIDVRSGNLNFSVPVLTAKAASGWSVPFRLSYNSQNWRLEPAGTTKKFDDNVGYGFGWRLQAGSITPVWSGWTASYYLFMDSTGAEYRLDQNSGNVWRSKQSIYVWFDANANTLYFRDGSSWYFGSVSSSGEADDGVMYPTLMKDINGNSITVTYQTGAGASWANSSARIYTIKDARVEAGQTYSFGYYLGNMSAVTSYIASGENFQMQYGTISLTAPFGTPNPTNTSVLTRVSNLGDATDFVYNSAGELTRVDLPKGGALEYDYNTVTYADGFSYREVSNRYLSKDPATQTVYAFSHEPSPVANVHQYTVLNDPGGLGQKYWAFSTTGADMGLVTQYQGRQLPGPVTLAQNDFTWALDAGNNSYIASTITTADPGQSYQAQKKVAQSLDTNGYGNVTQVQQFSYGNLSTPARTNDYTYSTNSSLLNAYIRDRMATASVTEGATNKTLVTNTYGTTAGQNNWGRPISSQTLTGTRTFTYDAKGNVATTALNGVTTTITMHDTGVVPTALTVGSLTENMTYNSYLGLTNTEGPNGVQSSLDYQDIAHVQWTQSPLQTGSIKDAYTYSTNITTVSVNGRWSRTTVDGLGRTIKAEAGTGATSTPPVTIVETEYDSCGCSPTGKVKRTSLPHAPGATPQWTTYAYDGIGRTVAVYSPDGASSTRYSYRGNTVTVTDPAGKWKKYQSDAFGRLTQVNEPNPSTAVGTVKALAVKAGMTNSSISVWPPGAGVWNYRRTVTLDHTKVSGGSALTNFPVLISVTDANFKTVSNGGGVGKADGTDIYFTSSDGTTKLDHEIESYNPATGALAAWVRVPSLSPSTDTVLYAYYGNPQVMDQQNKPGVWDGNFKGVFHLQDGTLLSGVDSTNQNHATNVTADATPSGKIQAGANFNGTQEVSIPSITVTTAVTLEAWIYPTALQSYDRIMCRAHNGGNPPWSNLCLLMAAQAAPNRTVGMNIIVSGVEYGVSSATGISPNNWYHVVGTYDGSSLKIYLNGVLSGSYSVSGSIQANSNPIKLSYNTPTQSMIGTIDEARISNAARSADWILTEYRNHNSPATFHTLGAQQPASGGGGTPVESPTFNQDGPSLIIATATSGATIYYTTDGSTPTTSSAVYSGPVTLSTSPYVTDYTYDLLDHLTNVSMPRPSGTQTRTFNYGTPPGPFLQSATNPETGTVSYTYNGNNRLATKIDAKNQKLVYSYDSLGRMTQIARYYNTTTEDTQQRTNYYYDSNTSTYDSGYSTNVAGRLAWVQYYGGNCTALGPPRTGCDKIQESYNYNVAGLMLGKRVRIIRGAANGARSASWTYDGEGRMLRATYPSGTAYDHAYDSMGRLNTMQRVSTGAWIVSAMTYGVAGEVLSMSGMLNETRAYNAQFQLTRLTVPSVLDIQYAYPSANNNGKLASQTDVISGEQILYTYDALNRLATAVTTDNPSVTQWGQSYTFDGFGNLTDQDVIKGSAPTMHVTYNASTNRQSGDTADANGNIGSGYTYDIANRLLKAGAGMPQYGYDAGNKRIARDLEFTFWAGNQKWETYTTGVSGSSVTFTLTGVNVYFGGRLIAKGTTHSGVASVAQDRLGSMNGKFYPFGQERPSATANDKEKFTGYFRDAATGLDYADQRYHNPGQGRFVTPDSYAGSVRATDPSSWNRYTYTGGDPINSVDPTGRTPFDLIEFTSTFIRFGYGYSPVAQPSGNDPSGYCQFIMGDGCSPDFSCGIGMVFSLSGSTPVCGENTIAVQNPNPHGQRPMPNIPCSIDVYGRGLDREGFRGSSSLHGYIVFTLTNRTIITFEGSYGGDGVLSGRVDYGGTGLSGNHPNSPNSPNGDRRLGSLTGTWVCPMIGQLENGIDAINGLRRPYDALGQAGPNSTSALHFLLDRLYLGTGWYNIPASMFIFGWNFSLELDPSQYPGATDAWTKI